MSVVKRLDGAQARRLEILSGIVDDVGVATRYIELILEAAPEDDIAAWWTAALIHYGRCFGKGVAPWGAGEVIASLSELLQVRHKHFRRLRDALVSHPGGLDHTYGTEAACSPDGRFHVHCAQVPMFRLGRLEAMDFSELLNTLQTLVDRRRIEVENDLRARLSEMSKEDFFELPAVTHTQSSDRTGAEIVHCSCGRTR